MSGYGAAAPLLLHGRKKGKEREGSGEREKKKNEYYISSLGYKDSVWEMCSFSFCSVNFYGFHLATGEGALGTLESRVRTP